MIKTVKVIIEKEIYIDIPDYQLTEDHIGKFERGIFELDGESHGEKVDSYFQYAAIMAAQDYPSSDGLGEIGSGYRQQYAKDKNYYVIVDEVYSDIETEIIDE